MKKLSIALLMSLSLSSAAFAKELAGVKVADKVTVAGKELALNGVGLRTKAIFKVYVAALYVEKTSKDATQVISSDQVKRVEMHMLRDLDKAKIVDAVKEGFANNSKAQMPQLKDRLDKFVAVIPDIKEKEKLTITYVPGKGTAITSSDGSEKVSVPGKDFADALFAVWLGKDPVDDDLKEGMLGNED